MKAIRRDHSTHCSVQPQYHGEANPNVPDEKKMYKVTGDHKQKDLAESVIKSFSVASLCECAKSRRINWTSVPVDFEFLVHDLSPSVLDNVQFRII